MKSRRRQQSAQRRDQNAPGLFGRSGTRDGLLGGLGNQERERRMRQQQESEGTSSPGHTPMPWESTGSGQGSDLPCWALSSQMGGDAGFSGRGARRNDRGLFHSRQRRNSSSNRVNLPIPAVDPTAPVVEEPARIQPRNTQIEIPPEIGSLAHPRATIQDPNGPTAVPISPMERHPVVRTPSRVGPEINTEARLPGYQEPLADGEDILKGWRQSGKGNCVTVAAIKAAQTAFGTDLANKEDPTRGVFTSAEPRKEGGLDIVMRDGFELSLTAKELSTAARSSGFKGSKGNEGMLESAHQIYAAVAKRAQMIGNDGISPKRLNYSGALATIEDDENTYDVDEHFGRLGLKDYTQKVKRSELKNHEAAISRTPGHAYFVTQGVRDNYGRTGSLGRGSDFGFTLQNSPLKKAE